MSWDEKNFENWKIVFSSDAIFSKYTPIISCFTLKIYFMQILQFDDQTYDPAVLKN